MGPHPVWLAIAKLMTQAAWRRETNIVKHRACISHGNPNFVITPPNCRDHIGPVALHEVHSASSRVDHEKGRAQGPGLSNIGSPRDAQASAGSIALQASTRPFTASTDLSNIACSSLLSSISTMRSTPPGADHRRHADIEALDAVLAVDIGRAGQHALLVLEIGFGHLDGRRRPAHRRPSRSSAGRRSRRRRRGCAGRSRRASPGWSSPSRRGRAAECRRPSNSGPAAPWCRRGRRARRRCTSFTETSNSLGQEVTEARGVEHAGHADHLLVRQAGDLAAAPRPSRRAGW